VWGDFFFIHLYFLFLFLSLFLLVGAAQAALDKVALRFCMV